MTANSATPGMSRRKREGREMDGFWGSTIASAMTSFPRSARIESRKTRFVRDKYDRQFPSLNNCARTTKEPLAAAQGGSERPPGTPKEPPKCRETTSALLLPRRWIDWSHPSPLVTEVLNRPPRKSTAPAADGYKTQDTGRIRSGTYETAGRDESPWDRTSKSEDRSAGESDCCAITRPTSNNAGAGSGASAAS